MDGFDHHLSVVLAERSQPKKIREKRINTYNLAIGKVKGSQRIEYGVRDALRRDK